MGCSNPFSTLTIILLSLVFVFIDSAKDKIPDGPTTTVTKHLSFPDFNPKTPRIYDEIKLLGSTYFSSRENSIQIPDVSAKTDFKHLAGKAIYSSPIRLFDPISKKPANFETTFTFQINTTENSEGGSGLSFIIVPDEFTVGRPGPWLGMLNDVCDADYKAIGIEFDTRKNPEFGDPNDNHLGINLASIVSTKTIDASDLGVYLKDGLVHRAWIRYDGKTRHIDIRISRDNATYPLKPAFSDFVDLSPFLKEYMFVGFSASTGNFSQIHNILSWNFTSVSEAILLVPTSETCESRIILEKRRIAHSKTPSSFLIFLAVVFLVFLVLINIYFSGKRKKETVESPIVLPDKKVRPRPPNKPRRFTIAEIQMATRFFSELQEMGGDTRGVTYKGTISNGCQVAVKRFSPQFLNKPGLEKRRLAKETVAISKIRHPNLVPIRGWCFDHKEAIIVYDYLPNGSLDRWLFGVGVLPWTRRFKVVKHVADALSYLHSKQLAHKNVKTSSVFLDVSFRATLGDFGLILDSAESKRFESAVSQKADVFDFGIFLLEVVGGRRRKRSNPGEMDLLDLAWARHESGEKEKVVDKRMGSGVNMAQAIRVLEIGLLCTLNENKGRPEIDDVSKLLNSEWAVIPELPMSRPVSLFPYNSTTGLCIGHACAPFT